jgi:hypothetical protein
MIKTAALLAMLCAIPMFVARGGPADIPVPVLSDLVLRTQASHDLPDLTLTPGIARDDLSLAQICATKWGEDKRLVTDAMKDRVDREYASTICPSGKAEIDHLLSRELGGADDVRNLWKQCYEKPVVDDAASAIASKKAGHPVVVYVPPSMVAEFGAHKKDRLENDFGKRVCLPTTDPQYMTLGQARNALSTNWVAAYIERYGDPRAAH